jgi:hypothetical protein
MHEEHIAVLIGEDGGSYSYSIIESICMALQQHGPSSLLGGVELKAPATQREFNTSPQRGIWTAARQTEYEAWRAIPVFYEELLDDVRKNNPGIRIHRTKFVDTVKKSKETGKESARSRGVIVGTTMEQGKDYYSSYSACARMMGFKITMISVLTKMRTLGWIPFFIDLKQAHQNTLVENRLPRNMYCYPLPGFEAPEGKPRIVWRMNTCAQGSPQAARLFSEDVIHTLREGGFSQSFNDDALFQKGDQRGEGAELAQWVDDFVGGAHPSVIDDIERLFRAKWPDCTIMRDWRNILGCDVTIDRNRCSAS